MLPPRPPALRWCVRLFRPGEETFEIAASDMNEAEAIAYATTYNSIMDGQRIACIASYPAGSDPDDVEGGAV